MADWLEEITKLRADFPDWRISLVRGIPDRWAAQWRDGSNEIYVERDNAAALKARLAFFKARMRVTA